MNLEIIKKLGTESGNKVSILFIHGAYHGAWCWENYQNFFAEHGYTSFALSLRGHGGSDGHEDVESAGFSDFLADVEFAIEKVIKESGCTPILIGHSLGGVLVRKIIERTDVPAAVLVSTPTRKALISGIGMLLRKYPIKTIKVLFTNNQIYLYDAPEILSFLFFNKNTSQTNLDKYIPRILSQKESKGIAMEVIKLQFKPYEKSTPVLVVGGENDVSFKKNHFAQLASFYNTEPVMIQDAPHDMMVEENWQKSASIIVDWLETTITQKEL